MISVRANEPPRARHELWTAWARAATGKRSEPFSEKLLGIGSLGFFEHQRHAFDRILEGRPVFLTAGTSSGKTFALALPLLEQLANRDISRVCFVYPTRALLESQRTEIGELAALRGLTHGVAMGGKRVGELLNAMSSRVIFATPDQIYWYFAKSVKHAGALAWSLTQVDDFVFDEVHVFKAYALDNLVWFIRRLKVLNPRARFHFLSATTARELFQYLQPLGEFDQPIQGESFTGPIQVEFASWGPITWHRRDQVLQCLKAGGAEHTVGIFNSARFVHRFFLKYGNRDGSRLHLAGTNKALFRYTGYMEKATRDGIVGKFQTDGGVLLTTSAAEVGVDFDCDHLLMEEFGAESTIQRFGRAGRGGRSAGVTVVSAPGLEERVRSCLPGDNPTRGEFVDALSRALGGFEHLAKSSEFAAYSQYVVNLRLGRTGGVVNEVLFQPEVRDRFKQWLTSGNLVRYGLRSTMPQVELANGAGADPFYILQVTPKDSLRASDDGRFTLARTDRSYDSLVWQPFAFDVMVDVLRTFSQGRLVDTDSGLLLCGDAPLRRFQELLPRGCSGKLFKRLEGPILKVDDVRVGLCFGDVIVRRTTGGSIVESDPELAVRGWYYLLLSSEDPGALGSVLWRLVYPNDELPHGVGDEQGIDALSKLHINKGASADLCFVRASQPQFAFVLEANYGACYEVWRELCESYA